MRDLLNEYASFVEAKEERNKAIRDSELLLIALSSLVRQDARQAVRILSYALMSLGTNVFSKDRTIIDSEVLDKFMEQGAKASWEVFDVGHFLQAVASLILVMMESPEYLEAMIKFLGEEKR